jgi:hypothetical protein
LLFNLLLVLLVLLVLLFYYYCYFYLQFSNPSNTKNGNNDSRSSEDERVAKVAKVEKPTSTLQLGSSLKYVREWCLENGARVAEVEALAKPMEVVTFAIDFLGAPPDLVAQMDYAKDAREILNYVVDYVNEGDDEL